jgi:hypothetical protein
MKAKTIFLLMAGLLTQVSLPVDVYAGPMSFHRQAGTFISVSLPRKDRLTLVSVVSVTSNGETLGGVAAYDDVMTKRPSDYIELFNNVGALLAVSWVDNFGIERLVVDRALVEEADTLQGVFVLVQTGDPI